MPTKKIEEAEEVTRCPECNSGHLSFDYERGELICEECGLVLTDQMIDQGPEWRAFDVEQGEKRARTGAPMTYTIHDKGPSTTIGGKNKDSYGKSIPTPNRAQLYRLREWQRRVRVSNAAARNPAFPPSEAPGLRVPVLFGTQAHRRGSVARRRDSEGGSGQGTHLGTRADGRRRGGDLHRVDPVQRAAHAARGRRRRRRDRSHDPEPLQGTDGEARHQGGIVSRPTPTMALDSFPRFRDRRRARRRQSTSR